MDLPVLPPVKPMLAKAVADVPEGEASLVLCRLLAMEDGFVPKKYDQEIKARAVRMVRDHLPTYGSGDQGRGRGRPFQLR